MKKNIKLFNKLFLYKHKLKFKYFLKNELNIDIIIKNTITVSDIESITLDLCWMDYKSKKCFNIGFADYLLVNFNDVKLTNIKIYNYNYNEHIEFLKDLSLFIYIRKYENYLNNILKNK
jgi:hypothetical protein